MEQGGNLGIAGLTRVATSACAVEWLESERITAAVRGNHEQMMAAALAFDTTLVLDQIGPGASWLDNGGGWWYASDAARRARSRSPSAGRPRSRACPT